MKNVKHILILAISILLVSGCSGGRGGGDSMVIAGSTSVQPYVEILAEDYVMAHAKQIIDVQGGGSSAGVQAVESGIADLGMSSRDLDENERHLWSIEIALDGLAIITHPDNPVSNLTLEQLRGIYTGDYTNWASFGGSDKKIHVVTREEGSGTRSAFESMVMDGQRITPKAIVQASNGAVRQLVSGDPFSIGYISLGLVEIGEQPVSAMRLDDIPPTLENIKNGTYALYHSFLLVALEAPSGEALQFIEYICSPDGHMVLAREGLIPGAGFEKE